MLKNRLLHHADNIELAREFYAAINRYDIPGVIALCDPDIERIEPAGFPSAGTYRGHAEVAAHLSQGRATWAQGSCEPEECILAGELVVVFLHVLVRLKDRSEWIDSRFADVLTFRNGMVVRMQTFAERDEARAWAQAVGQAGQGGRLPS